MAIDKVQQNSVYPGAIENSIKDTKAAMKEGDQKSAMNIEKIKIENKGVKIDTKA